jgi:hypothetical protein
MNIFNGKFQKEAIGKFKIACHSDGVIKAYMVLFHLVWGGNHDFVQRIRAVYSTCSLVT